MKIKFGPLSLKWRILLFYLMFGFMPLLTISYISYDIAADSIRRMTGRQLTQLMERVSQQTVSSFMKAKDDIYQLSQNPIIQLSFLQFSYGQRMETLRERLAVYRTNSGTLDIVALFTAEGEAVLTSPIINGELDEIISDREIREAFKSNFSITQHLTDGGRRIVFFKRVYDYEDEAVPLGMLVFVMPFSVFTDYIAHVNIADGMVRQIRSSSGELLYELADPYYGAGYDVYREYSIDVDELGWEIVLKIPEKALLSDIMALRNTSLIFAIIVGSVAFMSAILFVQRILTPVRQIIRGTEHFSKGDLDYRVNMNYGKEMRMLADAFDDMADSLLRRQNELVQANKLASLGLMAAGIAHEIKNPLAAIKTSIQVIKRRVRTEANLQLADGIIQEVDRLNKIVMDLLDFSRPGPANTMEYDLKDITGYCLQLMSRDIRAKNVKLTDRTKSCTVLVDPAQMQQVVLNLLINALSAVGRENGEIELHIYEDSGRNIFDVKDNGRGIPEDKLDKIFDPFFSMTAGGTGLGLSVVFNLLKQNNIEHKIISRENEGTIFRLIFSQVKDDEDSYS